MSANFEQVYERLFAYCERENFAGYDPFDSLNSRVFRASPLKYFRLPRLAWLQFFKRSGINLRSLFLVDKGVNPKALALFALAEMSRFRATGDELNAERARDLLSTLMSYKIVGSTSECQATAAFGYNFDWQSRAFYAPKDTPAIVPTAFAAQSFLEAYEAFGDQEYLDLCKDICRFIVSDLNRTIETEDELCFSYTPLDRTCVYNASLLAGECLAHVGAITENEEYLLLSAKAAKFVIRRQREDGAWVYGENNKQGWVDNFHTAYVLLSLERIASRVKDVREEATPAIEKGKRYWLENFFLDDCTPKYYDRETYPADIHSAAAAIVALCELGTEQPEMMSLANRVGEWTCENMLDKQGFFYYQKRKSGIVRIPYMRWGQAWMAYALARLIESKA